MQYIPLGANAYDDSAYGFPPVVLENWYGEAAPDRVDRPYRLIPTPGLTSFATGLNGAVRGMFQTDGLLSGSAVVAAGARVYDITSSGTVTEIGTITGTDEARFAASQADLVMTAGGTPYLVTSSLTTITISGAGGNINDVVEFAQRHIFLEDGSGRIWISDVGDPTTVTKFLTAETEPDNLLALATYANRVILFGTQSVEGYFHTGNALSPFSRDDTLSVKIGLLAKGAMTQADFGVFWVGDNGLVYRFSGGAPQRISTHAIERLIADVATASKADIRMSQHTWDGHLNIGLHLPGVGDYYHDVATGSWHRRRDLGGARHRANFYVHAFGGVYAGDRATGKVYQLGRDVYTHDGDYVRRVATAIIPVEDGRPTINNLTVEMQGGVGLVTGQGSDPKVMMRFAKDGREFSNEVSRSFGQRGAYNTRAVFYPRERFEPPAVLVEIATADPVPATVTGCAIDRARP